MCVASLAYEFYFWTMHPRDWKHFLDHGSREPIGIAQVSKEMAEHLNSASTTVYMDQEYARKAVDKHGLSVADFPSIFETVDYGTALADRDGHLTFLHDVEGQWFQVTIKCAPKDRKLYVVTFYKQKLSEVTRKKKKYKIIRE